MAGSACGTARLPSSRPRNTDRPGMGGRHPRLSDAHEHHRRRRRSGRHMLAVRHGLSANGNDHVHIMVQLAADDGWINPYHDRINAQKSCRRMEKTRPELVELARSDTGTRVSWQYGQWRQWPNGRRETSTATTRDGMRWTATREAGSSRRSPPQRCRASMSAGSWRRAPRHRAARTSSYAVCAGKASPSTQAAQGSRQRLVHRPRPGGRLQDHVA